MNKQKKWQEHFQGKDSLHFLSKNVKIVDFMG